MCAPLAGGQLLLRPSQDRYFLNGNRGLSLFKNIESAGTPRDYLAGTAEVEGQFEYVRFQGINSVADCRT